MYLLDTSILIKWLRRDLRARELLNSLPLDQTSISEITAFEILVGVRSNKQQGIALNLLAEFNRLSVIEDVSSTASYLVIKYPGIFDRKQTHTLFDAFIAATGWVHKLEIITLNSSHFASLKEPRLKIRVLDDKAENWV